MTTLQSYHQLHDEFFPELDGSYDHLIDTTRMNKALPNNTELTLRLDRHPGQSFLDRLRLAHQGVPEKSA